MLLDALHAHPAWKKLEREGKPLPIPYMMPDVVGLDWGTGKAQIRFRVEDNRWWAGLNQLRARILADFLVSGLREKIRESRKPQTEQRG